MADQEIEYIDPEKDLDVDNPESYTRDPEFYEYLKRVQASEGFGCVEPGDDWIDCLKPCYKLACKSIVEPATYAVEEFNRLKGTNLELHRVVRATSKMMVGILFYLTLQCNDGRFYEAKVYESFYEQKSIMTIFRPAKHYSSNSDNPEESVSPPSSKSGIDESTSGGSDGSDEIIRKKQKMT